MNLRAKDGEAAPAANSHRDTLSYSGSGKVSVSINSIVNSPKVQRQVRSAREIAANQTAHKK
jgi:hypothetical protein